MKTLRTSLIALATLTTLSASNAHASWLSDFTGIDMADSSYSLFQ